MRKFIKIICLVLLTATAQAQDPHFSQFFSSPLTLNPAFTGKFNGTWRLAVNHRDQWPTIPKAYVTTSGSIDFPILKSKIPEGDVFGIGISGLTDASSNNALKLNYGSLSVSYHKAIDENGFNTLGVGFQGTYSSTTIDRSGLLFEDELRQNGFQPNTSGEYLINPNLGNTQRYVDVNAGVLYSGSSNGENNYYFGVSMYHLNRPKVSFLRNSIANSWYLASRLTVHAGGTFPISDVAGVNVSIIHQSQNKANETVIGGALSLNANGDKDNPTSFYIGSWLRVNDAIIPYLGLEFSGIRFGASYDINTSALKAATGSRGGTEFSIIYTKRPSEYMGIPCPRF